MTVLSRPLALSETWAGVGFHTTSGDVRFTTFVRPVPRAGRAEAAAEPDATA